MSASQQEPWTVLRLLEWTTDFFKKRGSESPRLDAEVLLAHARGCSRIELYTAYGEVADDQQRVAFREMVRRRGDGTPVAQLVGYREFYSLRFRVDDQVLIPRPETEHLVVEALDWAKAVGGGKSVGGSKSVDGAKAVEGAKPGYVAESLDANDRPLRIADIGTGSGAIAVAVAKHLDGAEFTATDTTPAALRIAEWNAEHHGVQDRVTLLECDLLSGVDPAIKFDLICSNPPYVSESEYEELPVTVREYEPRDALVAGPKGTEVIARLIELAPQRLVSGGRLIVELSPMIAEASLAMAREHPELTDARLIKDLAGHHRILSVARR